jgi:beta-lactamase class C
MRKAARYFSLFAAGMVPAGCAGAGVAVTPGSPAASVARIERAAAPRATATPLNVAATIASVVASAEKSYGFPGAAVEVYYGGKAYAYYYGVQDRTTRVPVSAQTGFELGSLTKTFTALALELAVQYPSLIDSVNKGTKVTKVSLDDPATKYVYLFPVAHPQTETALAAPCPSASPEPVVPASKYSATWKAITLEDLADHTSTLPDQPANIFGTGTLPVPDRPCYGAQDLENYVATYNAPAGAKLGSSYLYSDIGYGVLGYALQGIYNVEYYTLMEYLILSKLTMHHTFDVSTAPAGYGANYATPYLGNGTTATYHWPFDAWPGGGTLRSTGPDMLYYLEAALQISPNAQINAAMKAAQVPIPAVKGGPVQGLAWAQESLDSTAGRKPFTVTWKDGATGGMSAWIGVVNPGSKTAFGVVVMVNESDGGAPAPGIATKILEDLAP